MTIAFATITAFALIQTIVILWLVARLRHTEDALNICIDQIAYLDPPESDARELTNE